MKAWLWCAAYALYFAVAFGACAAQLSSSHARIAAVVVQCKHDQAVASQGGNAGAARAAVDARCTAELDAIDRGEGGAP